MAAATEEIDYERLVALAAAGDAAARDALVEGIWPRLLQHIASQNAVRASHAAEDHTHDIAVRVIDRLMSGDLASDYLEWRRARGVHDRFVPWLLTVAENAAIDHMRHLHGRVKRAPAGDASSTPTSELSPGKRDLADLVLALSDHDERGTRPSFTNLQAINELIAFANQRFPPEQRRVLSLWLEGDSAGEIEAKLGLAPGAAEAQRRAIIATLRRHFLRDVGHSA